jgi:hypothetical protein
MSFASEVNIISDDCSLSYASPECEDSTTTIVNSPTVELGAMVTSLDGALQSVDERSGLRTMHIRSDQSQFGGLHNCFCPIGDAELLIQVIQVRLDGRKRDEQCIGDFLIR